MKAILTYHSIDSSGSVISIPPSTFGQHLRWLASSPVAVLSLPDLLRHPNDSDALAITFDDAFTNFQDEAWPRLRDHGLSVTLFVPTGFVGQTNEWAETPGGRMPRLPILDWASLGRLQEDGVILGAHSRTHADLRTLDGTALEEEIWGSVEDVSRETGRRPDTFAYPYGYWTPAAASTVRAACRCACTTELRPLGPGDDALLLPRLDAFYLKGPARLEQFGRASFREYLRLRSRMRALAQRVRGSNVS
ncbi:MAG: polysaccharide deacetylase family protein [Acidobacteriota bacterium]